MKDILFIEDWAKADGTCRATTYNRLAAGLIPQPIRVPGQRRPFWTAKMRKEWLAKLEAGAVA